MKYKDWLLEWLTVYVKTSTKERTYKKYRQQTEKYIIPMLGEYETNALSAIVLQRFSASLMESGLSANTVNGIICVMRASLKQAETAGVAEGHYTGNIVRPKIREKRVDCFTKEEQKKLERYIIRENHPKLCGVIICLYTGLRIGELLALTWEDIDFQHGLMKVAKSCHDCWAGGRYVKVSDTPKTPSSERVIPIPRSLLCRLREWKRGARGRFIVAGKTEQGAQVRSYQRTFELVLKKLGIAHKGFHALRHTFATRALEIGMDVKTLSEVLGHNDPAVTLRRYAHSLIEHKKEMMNKVGKLLE